jgi:hypothetical protein
MKLNKKELQEICKSKNLPVSGTKNDIIIRIMGNIKPKTQPTISSNNKKTSSPPSVIKKLVEKIPTIQIRKNNFGNFEHSETKIIFNNVTKRAYGKQNDDGTVSELSHEDIDICHKYKFAYDIPENLDKKGNIDDDNDEELDNNEEDDDEELIDEEELEAIDDEDIDDEEEVEEEVEEEYYEDD